MYGGIESINTVWNTYKILLLYFIEAVIRD
jgi:hypothetical protein